MNNLIHFSISNHQISTRAQLHIMLLLIAVFHSAPPPYAAAQPPSEPTRVYPYGAQGSFNSSLTIILVVLFSCFFIFGFFSFYIRQCIQGTPAPASDSNQQSVHSRRRHHPRGLHSAVIDSFPMFSYSTVKHLKIGKGALECAVCISEFEEDDTLRLLPKCDHVFHHDCIDVWLASHTTCPVCRFDLTKQCASPSVQACRSGESTHPIHELEPPPAQDVEVLSLQVLACNMVDRLVNEPEIGARFFRSHSMGHLLIEPGEDCERYTLRLPEEVKMRIVKFNRAKSTGGEVRKCGGEWSGRPDRWGFHVTPLFISRTISLGKGEGSTSSSNNRAPV